MLMNSLKFSASHFVILSLLASLSSASEAAPIYSTHVCTNKSLYEPNSAFHSNLNILLSSLTSNVSLHDGFFQTTTGQGNPDAVNGLFLCRGDVTNTVCQECVTAAAKEIIRRCPKDKESIIWYEDCMLRYSNNSFDILEPATNLMANKSIADSDQGRFRELLARLLKDLETKAANSPSKKKFSTGEEKFTTSQTLYGLAQCTPDFSVYICDTCLQSAIAYIPNCCDGQQGARALLPGCNIRYELYPFYKITANLSAPVVPPRSGGSKISLVVGMIVPIVSAAILVLGCCFLRKRASKRHIKAMDDGIRNDLTDVESLHFDLATIEDATNRFSDEVKIGQGGFGVVYKGILPNRQEIAVKRLSVTSSQGAVEFKNEAVIVAKLQHRNLVRLLGFCLEGQEKILVYEYIPNKSLDHFLFDPEKQRKLDWSTRFNIILGITRGILYLHEDSQIRIIHRDLKANNILLDVNMNPKISDFGIAKTFGTDQTKVTTQKIVGTYGYMSPEYAMYGQYSMKSDVFSYGVLVLEIVSGRKITEFYQSQHADDLLIYAWKNWKNRTPLKLLDPTLRDSYSRNEVMRCIQIGLLCVQENPADRPSMANIELFLNSYSVTLQLPRQPASFLGGRTPNRLKIDLESDQASSSSEILWSVDHSSITEVYPR